MAKQNDWGRFTSLEENDGYYVIGSSEGEPGSGKSHLWATAPDPIAWFLFDPDGLRGLADNAEFKAKDIRVRHYIDDLNIAKLPKDERTQKSLEALEMFKEDWDIAVKKARTLVIDKESMLWEIIRYAHDEVESPDPKNFHELHQYYHGWFADAMKHKLNFGLIRDVRDSWGKTGQSRNGNVQWGYTGVMKPEGNKRVRGLVHVNLYHSFDAEEGMFGVRIHEKCRLGPAKKLMGKTFYDMDFSDLAQKLYPESESSDWE